MFGTDDIVTAGLGIFNGIMQRHQFDKWFKWVIAICFVYWWSFSSVLGSLHAGGFDWAMAFTGALISAPVFSFLTWLKSPFSKDVTIVIPVEIKQKSDTQPDIYVAVKGEGK